MSGGLTLALLRLPLPWLPPEGLLMLAIHPQARTTPAVGAEIACSSEPSGVLAKRYGVSSETIRKWRKRGPADCQDLSARPHRLLRISHT